MLEALKQAWLGRGKCSPNPSVGALVVDGEQVLAKAYHQGQGTAHAEQQILQALGRQAQNKTLYVTLEPCNHWGRTPPCIHAIRDAGIRKVIYGFSNPNPIVSANNTSLWLKEQGIDVVYHPMPQVQDFYKSYAYWTKTGMPWVTAKIAHTLDGKIAGPRGERVYLTNDKCKKFTHKQRGYTDIILTTAKTIQQDNPTFKVATRKGYENKYLAIVDSKLSLTSSYQVFETAKHIHIFHDEKQIPSAPLLPNCTYHSLPVEDTGLNVKALIQRLGKLGFQDVWVEAGGQFFSTLHTQKLVQTTYLYLVPTLLGDDAIAAFRDKNLFSSNHQLSWHRADDNCIIYLEWLENTCSQD